MFTTTLGVLLLQNAPWDVLLERVRWAEKLGVDTVWVADHFVDPYRPDEDWFEAWSLLGAIAASTRTIKLGPLVSSVTLRNPALLARAAMTVDHISDGRLKLGVGAGGAPLDHSMTGIERLEPLERMERFGEFVEVIDGLLRDGTTRHEGRHFKIEDAVLSPRPVQRPRPPLVIGALGPKGMRIAAQHADVWNSYPVATGKRLSAGILSGDEAFDLMGERVALFDNYCRGAGRDPAEVQRSLLTFFGYRDPWPDVDTFRKFVERYRGVGFSDFVVYFPQEPEGEEAFSRLVDAWGAGNLDT